MTKIPRIAKTVYIASFIFHTERYQTAAAKPFADLVTFGGFMLLLFFDQYTDPTTLGDFYLLFLHSEYDDPFLNI